MKLYYVKGASPAKRWQRTQADAKAVAREVGGDFKLINAPIDSKGLPAFLNAMEYRLTQATVPATPAEAPAAPEPSKYPPGFEERREAALGKQRDVNDIVDWTFEAERWQVARFFEALASRLADEADSARGE